MQIVINILVMILMLGVLISLHELGHLSMAKLFKVYCFEYSIGFGPKILKKKRKNGETYFSIRCIPLGGYVSMYGEEGALPEDFEGTEIPPERSLEKISKWKAAIIMVAGVFTNYVLGLVLVFIAVSCFPIYYIGYGTDAAISMSEAETVSATFVYNEYGMDQSSEAYGAFEDALKEKKAGYPSEIDDFYLIEGISYTHTSGSSTTTYYVYDGLVEVTRDGSALGKYVAVYNPGTLTSDQPLINNLSLYPVLKDEQGNEVTTSESFTALGIPYVANTEAALSLDSSHSYTASFDVSLLPKHREGDQYDDFATAYTNRLSFSIDLTSSGSSWNDVGLTVRECKDWNTWGEAWEDWAYYVPWANKAIIEGIFSLFTPSGWSNVSGIIGMTSSVGTLMARGGAFMIFLYAGLISINLAFFNLLPFPGLDGWQLLVITVEGITRKKINPRIKGIVSYIGLGLLMVFAIAVAVMDIIRLVG